MHCRHCGEKMAEQSVYCSSCGTPISSAYPVKRLPQSKPAAAPISTDVPSFRASRENGLVAKYVTWALLLFAALLIMLCVLPSGSKEDNREIVVDGQVCYLIDLEGKPLNDYFSLCGRAGTISVSAVNDVQQKYSYDFFNPAMVKYSEVKEGGWVAYYGQYILYLPSGVKETTVQIKAAHLPFHDENEYYSIDEVRKYLSWI